jgi:integrase
MDMVNIPGVMHDSDRRGINPLTRAKISTLLETAKTKAPRYYPLFLCTARTGLRMGELLALRWEDLDFHNRILQVSRNYTHWTLTTPKSGENRKLDMSLELTQTLKNLEIGRQLEKVTRKWKDMPPGSSVTNTTGS